MKNTRILLILALSFLFITSDLKAQDKEEKKKQKFQIMLVKEEDGKKITFDTTIMKDDFDKEALQKELKEKYDIDVAFGEEGGMEYKWEDMEGDSVKMKKIKKYLKNPDASAYVFTDDDEDIDIKMINDGKKIVIKKEGDHDCVKDVVVEKIIKGDGDEEMTWYEYEVEEDGGDMKKEIIVSSGGDSKDARVFVKKFKHGGGDRDVKVWVDDNGQKHQKVYVKKAGDDADLFFVEAEQKLMITDPGAQDLKKAAIKSKGNGLNVKDLEVMILDDELGLSFTLESSGKTSIEILDEQGEKLFSEKVKYFPGTYDKDLKISLDEGTYFLHIAQGSTSYTKKIELKN